jgi:aryl-alcohol dehydrogenase-like predicted oxidoreductase
MISWKQLGHSSKLGVGTWAWGDKHVWGFGSGYAETDVKEAFTTSINAGIDFFDTAEVYGSGVSERLLGKFCSSLSRPVVIATKFMPYPWRLSKRDLEKAFERSRARLGVRSVHLYQMHWPLHLRSIETWMNALADEVERGHALAVGVSNYSADQMKRAHAILAKRNVPLISNQVEYSLLVRKPERNGLLQTCRELGITLIAYSPLAMGVLSGKYGPSHRLSGYRGIRFNGVLSQSQNLLGLLREIGQAHSGKKPSQIALNWTICKGTFPIPGAKNAAQAIENAGALGWSLDSSEIQSLEIAADAVRK